MQRQPSKAAAVLLALPEEDNELAHARSLLVTHGDMTKGCAVCSTRQIPLNPCSLWVWCPSSTSQFESQGSAPCNAAMVSASATVQMSSVCVQSSPQSHMRLAESPQ